MAIVANKANTTNVVLDQPLCTYNRAGAGTPNAAVTPLYAGEIYWDTTNKVRWKAVNMLNTGWRSLDPKPV